MGGPFHMRSALGRALGAGVLATALTGSSAWVAASPAGAVVVAFSPAADATMQGNLVDAGQEWTFDTDGTPGSEIAGPLFGPGVFQNPENIDAFTVFGGVYYFSTSNNATILDGGFSIDNDDIVAFDPMGAPGSRASIFFDPDAFLASDANVTSLSVGPGSELLLGFRNDEIFAGLQVDRGSVVGFSHLDPLSTRNLFFDGALFGGAAVLDGFEYVSATEMYLSTRGDNESLPGLGSFNDSDVVLWDGASASIAIAEAEWGVTSGGFDVQALAVIPEPSPSLLTTLGLVLLVAARSRI